MSVRDLPAVDRVLRAPESVALIECYGRSLVVAAVREALAAQRGSGKAASVEAIAAASRAALKRLMRPSQSRVFNLTGTVQSLPASQDMTLPGPDGIGCNLKVRERYLQEEAALPLLQAIQAGEGDRGHPGP